MGIFNRKPKIAIGDGTCLFINEVGAPTTRIFKVIPIQGNDKEIIIDFGNNEKYNINTRYLRAKRLIMYKTSSGKIIAQNPDKWGDIDLDNLGIKTYRFNLQNFGIEEGRSARRRWILPKSLSDKLLPLFKLLFICIAVGVVGWAALKGSTYLLELISKSRVIDCASLIPKQPLPLGANFTTPLGV